jgi:hypothetical protein
VLVLLVLLQGVVLLHVLVPVGGRGCSCFLLVGSGLLLVGQVVLSLVVLMVLWQLPELVRRHMLLLLMVGRGLQVGVLVVVVVLMW